MPGLRKVDDHSWAYDGNTNISYPEEDLAILSEVEGTSYWFNHRNAVIAAVVKRFPPSGPVFDIGGGNGYVSLGLQAAGFPAIVVEPDATGIATARKRGLATVQAAFQDLPLAPASIPAAGLFDVLEHIEGEADALKRLYDVMRQGGRAYIAVPAYRLLWSAEDVHAGHFRRYTARSLLRALEQAGFTPEYDTYFFRGLVPAVFLFRTVPSILGARGAGDGATVREHDLPDTLVGRMLKRSFATELQAIDAGARVGWGSSVLAVARKE